LRGVADGLNSGLSSTQGSINRLFQNTLGNMPVFQSPLQQAQAQRAAQEFNRQNSLQDRIRSVENSLRRRPGDAFLSSRLKSLQDQL